MQVHKISPEILSAARQLRDQYLPDYVIIEEIKPHDDKPVLSFSGEHNYTVFQVLQLLRKRFSNVHFQYVSPDLTVIS